MVYEEIKDEDFIKKAKDYYDILRLPIEDATVLNPFPGKNISIDEVKNAYRNLSLKFHIKEGGKLIDNERKISCENNILNWFKYIGSEKKISIKVKEISWRPWGKKATISSKLANIS